MSLMAFFTSARDVRWHLFSCSFDSHLTFCCIIILTSFLTHNPICNMQCMYTMYCYFLVLRIDSEKKQCDKLNAFFASILTFCLAKCFPGLTLPQSQEFAKKCTNKPQSIHLNKGVSMLKMLMYDSENPTKRLNFPALN